jgi:hypothetical protein
VGTTNADTKVAALRVYRMTRGLCHFCAEKWGKGHKCSTTVQLHAIQELWELLVSDQDETFTGTKLND